MTYNPLEELLHSCINFRLSNRLKTKIDGNNVLLQEFHHIAAKIAKIAAFTQDFAAFPIIPACPLPRCPRRTFAFSRFPPSILAFSRLSRFSLFSPFLAFPLLLPLSLVFSRLSSPFLAFLYFILFLPFLSFSRIYSPFLAFPLLFSPPHSLLTRRPQPPPQSVCNAYEIYEPPFFTVSTLFLCLFLRYPQICISYIAMPNTSRR
ncbi:hypothetical protein E2R60_07925 [Paenibacillus dendritiformis]|uniref:hypothetical protein n=1 Tax=Paenibacillus dendritiformis TaxID=130049 RepID=UPI001059E396|nr:hypothetical protein [Paenibacillus dendritiformis]TDL55477.1 hypothetical protein E2R60_07925 [Paenibacillus dendritiformis]